MAWSDPNGITLDVSANLFRFAAPPAQKSNNYVYAPTIEGSYYLKLSPSAHKELFKNVDSSFKYVSASFLSDLRDSAVKWDSLDKTSQSSDMSSVKKEEDFIRKWRAPWLKVTEKSLFKSHIKVPVRADDGGMDFATCIEVFNTIANGTKFKNLWYQELTQLWQRPTVGGVLKPSRCAAVPLTKSLKIYIEENGSKRFENAGNVFRECVDKINDSGMEHKCTLELVQQRPSFPYHPLSADPFGLYTTYVHMDDWDAYMRNLALGGDPPIRKFVKVPSDMMDTVGGAFEGRAETARQVTNDLLKEAPPGGYKERPEILKKATEKLQKSTDYYNKLPNYTFGPWSELSALKILNARRKRDMKDDQKTVMGLSAPMIAESVGWSWKPAGIKNLLQMENFLYIAEWLHLSAFSWGDFLDPSSESQGVTSEMPENLVLGTSETKSLMTRYEYAWQNLFTEEDALHKELTGNVNIVHGDLDICCNIPDVPVKYDVLDVDGKYTWDVIDALSKNRDVQQGPSPQDDTVTVATMRDIAANYPFVAYSISYDVEMYGESYILNTDDPECRVVFYPFMRPFFHKVEDELDKLLFDKMKEMAKSKVAQLKR